MALGFWFLAFGLWPRLSLYAFGLDSGFSLFVAALTVAVALALLWLWLFLALGFFNWLLAPGLRALGIGFWVLGLMFWLFGNLVSRCWILGFWALGSGSWDLDYLHQQVRADPSR